MKESRNTSEKDAAGQYEEFVKVTYENLLEQRLGRVFLRKLYTGKSAHKHEIDVSIELSIAGLEILILIECKHYKRKVGIENVLTLAQRMEDIGAHKGVIVTTTGFQPGAEKIASAHKIALVTTVPVWRILMHATDRTGRSVGFRVSDGYTIGGSGRGNQLAGYTVAAKNLRANTTTSATESWLSIIIWLVDPDGELGLNKKRIKEKQDLNSLKRKFDELPDIIKEIEKKREEHQPHSGPHFFPSHADIPEDPLAVASMLPKPVACKKCGCSLPAIFHWGWWGCKRSSKKNRA